MRHSAIAVLIIIGLVFGAALCLTGCSRSEATADAARPDVIAIDAMAALGTLDRPPVEFPHDRHSAAASEQGKTCESCHMRLESGRLSLKFMRSEDAGYQDVMDIYHDHCISCHTETREAGRPSGPEACGECHRRQPRYESSWTEIGFSKSLHYRHVDANDEKCDLCHHVYDDEQQKLVYAKNQESSCRDCHRQEAAGDTPSLRQAVHTQCVGCHRDHVGTGPATCAGCHDAEKQRAYEVVADPPRLMRNQPDFVLLSAPLEERDQSKLGTVPFSHVGHEGFTDNCRACHHESMQACHQCHTLPGTEAGGGVTLQQAMHGTAASQSCIGCHETAKGAPDCAGCHAAMPQGQLSENACPICHQGPLPDRVERERGRFTSLDQFRPGAREFRLSFADKDIPDTVLIRVLSNKYEAAVFPHRQIIERLRAAIADNKIATYFHGRDDVVCQGCHHHTPVGTAPPLCESCHGEPFDQQDIHRPGLMGAYHRQCLGCHQQMNITQPSDCVGCHAEKSES